MTATTARLARMVDAAVAQNVNRRAADELARNWLVAEDESPTPVADLAAMINHRRYHNMLAWGDWGGVSRELLLADNDHPHAPTSPAAASIANDDMHRSFNYHVCRLQQRLEEE